MPRPNIPDDFFTYLQQVQDRVQRLEDAAAAAANVPAAPAATSSGAAVYFATGGATSLTLPLAGNYVVLFNGYGGWSPSDGGGGITISTTSGTLAVGAVQAAQDTGIAHYVNITAGSWGYLAGAATGAVLSFGKVGNSADGGYGSLLAFLTT